MKKKPVEILLIEGDPGEARLVQEALAEAGATRFKLDWVADLAKGLKALHRDPAAVILLDLNLPDSTGIDTLRKVHAQVPHIPIILLTGFEDEIQAPKAVHEGAQDYLVKGLLDGNFFVRTIRYAIERKQAEEELQLSLNQIEHNLGLLIALNQAAQTVQRARSPEEVYASLQEQMTHLGFKATVFELQNAKEGMRIAYLNYDSRLVRKAEKLTGLSMNDFRLRPRQDSLFQRVLAQGETVHVADAAQAVADVLPVKLHALARPISELFHLEPSTFASLNVEGKAIGILAVTGGNLSEADNQAVTAFANQTAIALHTAGLLKDAQQELAQRKQVEEALVAERNLFRTLIDNLPDAVYAKDTASRFLLGNDAVARVMGAASPDELIGKTDHDFFPEKLAMQYFADEQVIIQSGKAEINREEPIIYPDGSQGWVLTTQVPLRDQNGAVVGLMGIGRTITERKREEEALEKTKDYWKSLVENTSDLVTVVDENAVVFYQNPAVEHILGYKPEEIIGKNAVEFVHPEDWSHAWEVLTTTLTYAVSKRPLVVVRFHCKDGSWRDMETTGEVRTDETGRGVAVLTSRDITERKRVEEALSKTERIYRQAITQTGSFPYQRDYDEEKYAFLGEGFEQLTGYTPEEMTGALFNSRLRQIESYGESRHLSHEQRIQLAHQGGIKEWREDYAFERKDGTLIWLADHATPIYNDSGEIVGSLGILTDITERKRTEQALQISEERLRLITDNMLDMVVSTDLEGIILYASPSHKIILGYEPASMLGKSIYDFMHPEDIDQVRNFALAALQNKTSGTQEYRYRHADGHYMWQESTGALITDDQGTPVGAVFNTRDITERKRAEEALGQSEERYRNLFQNSLEGIGLSQGNKIIDANKALLDIFGYDDLAEFTKVPLLDNVIPAFQGLIREYLEKVNKGEPHDEKFTYQIIRKDRAVRDIDISVGHLKIGDDVYSLSTFRDITESKLAEFERTRQAEELARLYRASSSLLTESPFDLPALAHTILKIVLDEFGQSNCSLFLVEKGSDKLTRIAALGPFADQVSKVTMTLDGQGLVPQAIRTGECINSRDVRTDPAYVAGWEMARSELTVPLKVGNQVIGAIDVQSAVMGFFSVDDERMMTIFAERAALALEHARLYTQTERRLENLTALRVVDTAIASSFDVNFTLGILLDQVTKRLGVEAVNIMVFNPTSQTIQTSIAQGFRSGRLGQSGLRLGENLAKQVVRERRPIAIEDLASVTEEIPGVTDLVRAGFKAYLGVPLIAKGLTKGVLEIYQSGSFSLDEEQRTFLDMLAGQAAIAIDSAQLFENLQGSNVELMMAYDETIEGWSQALDLRDKETEGHSKRVTETTVKLAASFGSAPEELIHIRRGALLHDIGKLGVPDEILRKPGPLTEEEWVIMRSHPQFAYEMLAPITYLHPALDIPYCHHEKWDGSGYPRGLKGNQIPLAARIFTVVDVWDALTSDRPYREAWTEEKALAYIKEQAGKHFDPGVVNAFFREIPDRV